MQYSQIIINKGKTYGAVHASQPLCGLHRLDAAYMKH